MEIRNIRKIFEEEIEIRWWDLRSTNRTKCEAILIKRKTNINYFNLSHKINN
jgi:hypothetical protein